MAATSPYYAFFGCFFLAVAGAYRSLSEASWRPVAAGLLAAAVVSAAGFLCSLPFVLAQREHGSNPAVAHRHSNEAEVYCLKVTQLLLPDGDHRIQGLGYVTRLYNTDAPNSNENRDSTLGAVGVVGFLVLLGRLLMARHGPTLLSGLAALNGAALLLGASGGLGGLFNFLVFAQVRCYNRVCVFIAFWSLLAVGILIDRWAARGWRGRGPLAALALGLFGLWDLTSVRQAPHHSELRTHHAGWVDFGNRMEQAMPPGGMVFQLPAASDPEAGVVHAMPDYAHLTCHVYTAHAPVELRDEPQPPLGRVGPTRGRAPGTGDGAGPVPGRVRRRLRGPPRVRGPRGRRPCGACAHCWAGKPCRPALANNCCLGSTRRQRPCARPCRMRTGNARRTGS